MEGEWIITAQWDKCYNRGIYKKLEIALWITSLNKLPAFSFWIIPLCILPKVGLLGHLKDENNLAQKRCNDLPGEYSSIFNRGNKIVDNSRFRLLRKRIRQLLNQPCGQWLPAGGALILSMSAQVKKHVFSYPISQINTSQRNLAVYISLFPLYNGGSCAHIIKRSDLLRIP